MMNALMAPQTERRNSLSHHAPRRLGGMNFGVIVSAPSLPIRTIGRTMIEFQRLCAAMIAAMVSVGAASAQPQAIATFKSWSVFVREVEGDRICFAASEAQDKAPQSVNHGEVFFLVATWKSGAAVNQPSFMAGYNLKDAPAPAIRVGSEKFTMYASQNEAFIESAKDEQALISAMKRGADMRVSAVSSRGTATSYTMSLQGLSAALEKVAEVCR
jgi:invasion protein IalB